MSSQILGVAFLILILQCVQISYTYPNGAPSSQCRSLSPSHSENTAQQSPSPYIIKIDKTSVKGGQPVRVTLTSPSQNVPFAGFIALGQKFSSTYGDFDSSSGTMKVPAVGAGEKSPTKTLSCHSVKDSGLTHSSKTPKTIVEFDWIAPNEDGEFVILASFVQDFKTFWGHQSSEKIRVTRDSQLQESAAGGNGNQENVVNQISAAAKQRLSNYYSGCGSTKGCFGLPGGCIAGETCELMTTFQRKGDTHVFQVAGRLLGGAGYVATGLSLDDKMVSPLL